MSNSPFITIIIPVYNAEQYLNRCIDSVLNQKYTNFELLLVDDGSKDNSGNICDQYVGVDSRIRVFHKQNGGVSSARNLGLVHSKGLWVTFVDADDWVLDTWLSNFMNQSADLVVQSFILPKNQIMGICSQKSSSSCVLEQLYANRLIGYCWCKLFNNKIIKEKSLRFDENLSFREDEDFVLTYASFVDTVAVVDKAGYMYTLPDENKYKNSFELNLYFYKKIKKARYVSDNLLMFFWNDCWGMLVEKYISKDLSRYHYLKLLRKESKKDIQKIKKISCLTKLFWRTSSFLSHIYMSIKLNAFFYK